MSSFLSGGGRTYGFELEIVKSPSTSTRTSQTSSSPSSTLSESSNSPHAISTRKPRTPRKRPNQTYNEAAALLSTAYPNIFSTKHLTKNSRKFAKPHDCSFFDESSEILLPFRTIDESAFLLQPSPIQAKPCSSMEPKVARFCGEAHRSNSSGGEMEIDSKVNNCSGLCDEYYEDDFDAESIILDEEIEEGIDSIMGNLCVDNDAVDELNSGSSYPMGQIGQFNSWYGNPMGIGFGGKFQFGFGHRRGIRALRHVDEGNWWSFPVVDVLQISPKFNSATTTGNKSATTTAATNNITTRKKGSSLADKNKKPVEKPATVSKRQEQAKENPNPKPNPGLLLKLNYDDVLNAWSGRGSPFSDDISGADVAGNDVSARLAQIDLFSDGGLREASVLRYKEKRRTRLFSKKIRYQVRKVNADRRPRMKGRFVRRSNSNTSGQRSNG